MFRWLAIVTLAGGSSSAWTSYMVLFENIVAKSNPDYMEFNYTISEDHRFLNVSINIVQPFDHFQMDFDLRANVAAKNSQKQTQNIEILHRSEDYCRYIGMKPIPDVMFKILFEELRSKSDGFMIKCPVAMGRYTVTNYEVDSSRLPPYMPNCQWRAKVVAYFNGTTSSIPIFDILFDGTLNNDQSWKRFKTLNRKH